MLLIYDPQMAPTSFTGEKLRYKRKSEEPQGNPLVKEGISLLSPGHTYSLFQSCNSHWRETAKPGRAATHSCGSRLRGLQMAKAFWCVCAGSTYSSQGKQKTKNKKKIL